MTLPSGQKWFAFFGGNFSWLSWAGGLALVTLGLAAIAVSSRLQRSLRRTAARMMFHEWAARRAQRLHVSEVLEKAGGVGELTRSLPELVREAADVEPVTVYVRDRAQGSYVPVSSTLTPVPSEAVRDDDPLPKMLRRVGCVHLLLGSAHDMKNISIYAVNAGPLKSARAACAVPLLVGGELLGLLLCGGTRGRSRLGLRSLACLERLAPQLAASLRRFSDPASGREANRSDPATKRGDSPNGHSRHDHHGAPRASVVRAPGDPSVRKDAEAAP